MEGLEEEEWGEEEEEIRRCRGRVNPGMFLMGEAMCALLFFFIHLPSLPPSLSPPT